MDESIRSEQESDGGRAEGTEGVSHPTNGTSTLADFDPRETPSSILLSELVAEREGVDPCSLPPVYESVEPEALDNLFTDDRSRRSNVAVTFEYLGYDVHVSPGSMSVTLGE
ncbi:HalOD1 output domain-containing protein [Haloarcula marina]|uniref:HalOD1 output domain-containing protein n=1 Tax=Haloarcula marina TaxID=2961574 RepID=UPI0020B8381B|nr:HalOD1 output domain-containing protein [Halomicroarcula marina]